MITKKSNHLILLWVLTLPVAAYSFDLPSESSLPGRRAQSGRTATIALPSESQLPLSKRTLISNTDSQVANQVVALPSESQLPAVFQSLKTPADNSSGTGQQATEKRTETANTETANTEKADPTKQDSVDPAAILKKEVELLAEEGETTPWARLIQDGHCGAVTSIAFSSDGKTLYTAGRDKLVHVWGVDDNQKWIHRDTVRWQVGRGPSGTISSVLPADPFLFVSGLGVKAGREIGVLDRNTLATRNPLLNTVDLSSQDTEVLVDSSSQDQLRIVSGDSRGGIERWDFDRIIGRWDPTRIRDATQSRTGFTPMARVGASGIVIPVRTDKNADGSWHLDVIGIKDGKTVESLKHEASAAQSQEALGAMFEDHAKGRGVPWDASKMAEIAKLVIPLAPSNCTAVVASPSGKFVAALDDKRWLFVWETGKGLILKYRKQDVVAQAFKDTPFDFTCIVWTDSEKSFVVGEGNIETGRGRVQKWTQNAAGRFRVEASVDVDKTPTHIAAKGNWLALDSGPQIQVRKMSDLSFTAELGRNSLRAPKRIQWSLDGNVAWKWVDAAGNEFAMGIATNELGESRLQWLEGSGRPWLPVPSIPNAELPRFDGKANRNPNVPGVGPSSLELAVDPGESILSRYGPISASCWILDSKSKPIGLAVCFLDDPEIRVFGFPPLGTKVCPLWRVFRGHEDTINALQCAQDGRYLISSCQDRRICIWPLVGWDTARDAKFDPMSKWGLEAEIGPSGIDVVAVAPEGPLYSRGVRSGDRIVKLAWTEPNPQTGKLESASTEKPDEIWRRLGQSNYVTNFAFWYQRGGLDAPRQGFKRVCQWEPLLSIAVSTDREWAAWTPLGFYDASINGDRLFGWQLNRGPDKRPDFVPANRFRASLERPDVIGKLLQTGNILKALDSVAARIPGGPNGVLSSLIALQPTVEISAPKIGTPSLGNQVRLRANVTMQKGQTLASSRAYVNGVVATDYRLIGPAQGTVNPADPDTRHFLVEWDAAIPADRRLKFQVFVETAEHIVGVGEAVVDRKVEKRDTPKANLYVVTAGVSQYRDPSLNLSRPSFNAKRIADAIASNAIGNTHPQVSVLTDAMVTPVAWRSAIETMAERLQGNVSPDDLVLIYLTGHGLIDPKTQEYHFVTSRASTRDLRAAKYEDCLSLEDLRALRKVACRKLVILDTCHSGAAQSQSPSRLKQAVRSLQSDQIFVMTASDGNQLAYEDAFTDPLKEALDGKADTDKDRLVTLQEAFLYVKESMKKQAKPQYPTLGPVDLVDFADFSIVRTAPKAFPIASRPSLLLDSSLRQ